MLVSQWRLWRPQLLLLLAIAAAGVLQQQQTPGSRGSSRQVSPSFPHIVAAIAEGAFRDVDDGSSSGSGRRQTPGSGSSRQDGTPGTPQGAAAAGAAQSNGSAAGSKQFAGNVSAGGPSAAAAADAAAAEESIPRLIRRPYSERSGNYLKLPQSFLKKQVDSQGQPIEMSPQRLKEEIDRMFNMKPDEVERQTDAIARSVDAFRSSAQPSGRLIIAIADLQASNGESKQSVDKQKHPESANKQTAGSNSSRGPSVVTREEAEALGRAAVNSVRLEKEKLADKVKVLPDVGLVVIDFSPTTTVDEIKDTVKDIWMRSPSAWLIEPDSEVTIRVGAPSDGAATATAVAAAQVEGSSTGAKEGDSNSGGEPTNFESGLGAADAEPSTDKEADDDEYHSDYEDDDDDDDSDEDYEDYDADEDEGDDDDDDDDDDDEDGHDQVQESEHAEAGNDRAADLLAGVSSAEGSTSRKLASASPALRHQAKDDSSSKKQLQQDKHAKQPPQKKTKHKEIKSLQAEGSSSKGAPRKPAAGDRAPISSSSSKQKITRDPPAHKSGKMRAQGLEEKPAKQQRPQQQKQQKQQPHKTARSRQQKGDSQELSYSKGQLSPEPLPASHIQQLQLPDPVVATEEQFASHMRRLDASSWKDEAAADVGGAALDAAASATAAKQQPAAAAEAGKEAPEAAAEAAAADAEDTEEDIQTREAFLVHGQPPNDQYYSRQWGLKHSKYGCRMPEAWRLAYSSPWTSRRDEDIERQPAGRLLAKRRKSKQRQQRQEASDRIQQQSLIVAVIDTGVDYRHEDLRNRMWRNTGEIPDNGIDDDGNGYIDDYYGYDFEGERPNPSDEHGHGTHVAGIIAAAANNGIGVAGANWRVKVMPLKFHRRSSAAVEAIAYSIRMGAKISTNSWGFSFRSEALRLALEQADAHGQLFVCAVDNAGADNTTAKDFPPNWGYDWRTGAGFRNILRVANLTIAGTLAPSSNYGRYNVDIAAPGTEIISTLPGRQYGDNYGFKSGTSMATPLVAGVAAMVWGERPSLTATEVREILLHTATPLPSLAEATASGGTLNAGAAVSLAHALNDLQKGIPSPLAEAFFMWKAEQRRLHAQAIAMQQVSGGHSSTSKKYPPESSSGYYSYDPIDEGSSYAESAYSNPNPQMPSSMSSPFPLQPVSYLPMPAVSLQQPWLVPMGPVNPISAAPHFGSSSGGHSNKGIDLMPSAAASTPMGLSSLLVHPLTFVNNLMQNPASAFQFF